MTFTKEEVLIIMSDEHCLRTERKLCRRASAMDLVDHWIELRQEINHSHTHKVTHEPTLFD
jgi:hypothetical protein